MADATVLTEHPHAKSDSAVSTKCVKGESLQVSTHKIDAAFFSHAASEYWEWRAVFDRDPASHISQHPDYVLTELQFTREPQHRPATLIVCRQGSETLGAAVLVPKSIAGEKRFGPAWDLKGYRLAGNRLISNGNAEVELRLLEAVRQKLSETQADFLLAEDVEDSDAIVQLADQVAGGLHVFRPALPQSRHRIQMPDSFDEYLGKFSSKSRNTLKRKVRQFGECRLERITRPDQVSDFLAAAQQVARNSWQSDLLGLRILNDEFEIQLFTFLATQDALCAYLLWKDDAPVSFCIGTLHNGVFDYEEVGYDRAFSNRSPGQVLVFKMIEDLYENDTPRVFDFGGGDAEYKRQFGNAVSESGHVWLLRPGFRSKLIVGYLKGRRAFSSMLRRVLSGTGLLDRVRRMTRRGINGSK